MPPNISAPSRTPSFPACIFPQRHYHDGVTATPPETPLSNTIDASNTTADTPPLDSATPSGAAAHARSKGGLLKVLGMWFGIAAALGNTIAAGIVRPPGDIAQRLPNTYLFLGVWVVGGVYALVGASSMAELGASIPRSGGQYNFSRRAIETVRKSLLRRWRDFQGPRRT